MPPRAGALHGIPASSFFLLSMGWLPGLLAAAAAAAASLADDPMDAGAASLADDPMGAGAILALTEWSASSSAGLELPKVTVPGDLLSDLEAGGIIGDPLYERTFIANQSVWNDATWTYSTEIRVRDVTAPRATLVFDGVKMGARISVDGVALGVATDQFLRYAFDLRNASHDLLAGRETARVDVAFAPDHAVDGRFMACSGGWDWAPYSHTFLEGAHTFSKGLWKDAYVALSSGVVVTAVVPQIRYKGPYAVAPLQDGDHGGFSVAVNVHVSADRPRTLRLALDTDWGATTQASVQVPAGDATLSLAVDADDVTGGWGSLEYGTVGHTPGQVLGGRWKPLHYLYERTLYRDVIAACGDGGCYVKNDRAAAPFAGHVVVQALDLATGGLSALQTEAVDLDAGPATIAFFDLPRSVEATREILLITCVDADGTTVATNEAYFATPGALVLPEAEVTAVVGDGGDVVLATNATALFVTLTTLANGRFEDNSFTLLPPGRTIKFIPFDDTIDAALLTSSLRVEHLKENQRLL